MEATQRPPLVVIRVTPTPNVVTPTKEPTSTPTEKPTEEPTKEPTSAPTENPTDVPTTSPEEGPTNPPVVVVPTQAPVEPYAPIEYEMNAITMSGGIYPDYAVEAKKDLYNYISTDGLDANIIFELVSRPFKNGIAVWTDMNFDSSKNAYEQLDFALKSSICEVCGRVVIKERPENQTAIMAVFSAIEQTGEYEQVNKLLLEYLYNYTVRNEANPNERLIIGCKGH